MKSRLLDVDPLTKVRRMFTPSTDGNTWVESADQEVGGLVKANKELRDISRGWGDGRRVASIPLVVWEELLRNGIANDKKRLLKWLDDPDNRAFRTKTGSLSK